MFSSKFQISKSTIFKFHRLPGIFVLREFSASCALEIIEGFQRLVIVKCSLVADYPSNRCSIFAVAVSKLLDDGFDANEPFPVDISGYPVFVADKVPGGVIVASALSTVVDHSGRLG